MSSNSSIYDNLWCRNINNPVPDLFVAPLLCRLILLISVAPFAHSEYTSLTCTPSSCQRAFESYRSEGSERGISVLLQIAIAANEQRP